MNDRSTNEVLSGESARLYTYEAARIILGRTPSPDEAARWLAIVNVDGPLKLMQILGNIGSTGLPEQIPTHWPNGHYYSPVVNPDSNVQEYHRHELSLDFKDIKGIDLDLASMIKLWTDNSEYLISHPFPMNENGVTRYHQENGSFPGGDAVFVGAIMKSYSPKHIIEIGSGNSTACMLDWADRLGMTDLRITCIEPDAGRLRNVLRPGDHVDIIEKLVQHIDVGLFETLSAGDILFIDSTHVLKTGSDVHYELFYILAVVAPGVLIHFHDCAYPFEYPREAVFDMNFSWNEAYALRAFLMYNTAFKVILWNSMFYQFCPPDMRERFASLSQNPGGGLWITKV